MAKNTDGVRAVLSISVSFLLRVLRRKGTQVPIWMPTDCWSFSLRLPRSWHGGAMWRLGVILTKNRIKAIDFQHPRLHTPRVYLASNGRPRIGSSVLPTG